MRYHFTHLAAFYLILILFLAGCKTEPATLQPVLYPDVEMDRFQEEVDRFKAFDANYGTEQNAVVFTGSSSIRLWYSLQDDMAPIQVLNRGIGGSTLPEISKYAEDLIFKYHPRYIVLYCGENDMDLDQVAPEQTAKAFQYLANLVTERLPDSDLIYLSAKPSVLRWEKWEKMQKGNALIKEIVDGLDRFHYLDVSQTMLDGEGKVKPGIFIEDNLHMNEKGYAGWTSIVKPYLMELMDLSYLRPEVAYGPLFEAVQMGRVFPDSKTFVDCSPKASTQEMLDVFENESQNQGFDLVKFVNDYFDPPMNYASGFESDASKSPEEHINALWEVLQRKPDDAQPGSLIPLPHPYIVPGGRFGEIYYWDSYFTILGLQAAGRDDLVGNMADNFAFMVDEIGFIPNGNRTYFLGRSQPPFFSLIVRVLTEMKGPETWKTYLPMLEKEYRFWTNGLFWLKEGDHKRLVRMQDGSYLNRYWDNYPEPRPESYKEDVELAEESGRDPQEIYRDLRAACESGWDFSSRWFRDGKNLSTIRTAEIIPPDLNALLYHLELSLMEAHGVSGNDERKVFYEKQALARKAALLKTCWNEEAGVFMDYDYVNKEFTGIPSLATMFPLMFRMATPEQAEKVKKVIEKDFLKPGGVVTTLNKTGEQWDSPNGWAPLQWVTIQGLRNYGYDELADQIKSRWIALNEKVYKNTGKMVEKYNVMDMTLEAGGGEYPVQDGFGWTNGVLLKLLSEE